jgi:long-chain fatty acid transport protein
MRVSQVVQTALLVFVALPQTVAAQGIALSGAGPINRSMGGAATAALIDAAGALYWNPASISALTHSEMSFGMELAIPTGEISSRVAGNALGPGVPPVTLEGTSRSESGAAAIPAFAYVHKPEDSRWTYGLGVFGIGGFVANYPASLNNPVLTPPPPNGLGLGQVAAQFDLIQLAPTLCYELSPHLSVGFAPTVVLGRLVAKPALFAAPDDANGDGSATYPAAIGTRTHWGAGFQVGAYYRTDSHWHFGATLKSPQWLETLRFNSEDELGAPRLIKFRVDYPLIASIGASYSGLENYVFACDLRYLDYADTAGFESAAFDETGAITGLGWNSVMAVALGVQRRMTDRLTLRCGYDFNENPVPSANTSVNAASALIIKHWLCLGLSYQVLSNAVCSVAYVHGFQNSITGPIQTPLGAVPGTSVTSTG